MTEQNPIHNPQTTPDKNQTLGKIVVFFQTIGGHIPQPLMQVLKQFYGNKKIFYPVVGAFSLILFTLILGIIFGNRTSQIAQTSPSHSPTPSAPTITTATPVPDALTAIETQLAKLKDQINTLDVQQSRLQPPQINYSIRF